MCSLSSVCVNDDLAACESGVTVRTSDHEFSCGVHVEDMVALEERSGLRCESLDEHRKEDVLYVLADLRLHCLVHTLLSELGAAVCIVHLSERFRCELVVLSRDHDCVHAYRLVSLVVIFDCEL